MRKPNVAHSRYEPRLAKRSTPYDRLAPIYDVIEAPMEWLAMKHWRRELIALATGPRVLEAGVGTGKNLPFYAPGLDITVFDLSASMLYRSRRRPCASDVYRVVMDAEQLGFPDAIFDTALASFLFCSVAEPIEGLRELSRVVRPNGRILLLEHVRPGTPWLGRLFDRLNPLARTILGPNINRDTVGNVRRAGLLIEEERNLYRDIVKLLVCRTAKN